MQTGAATVEISMDFLGKQKMELPFDMAVLLLGLYSKNLETPMHNYLCTPMFIAVQFIKLWYMYTMKYYTAERKKELLPFASAWMELKSIMLSEISQVVKNKYHIISTISGI